VTGPPLPRADKGTVARVLVTAAVLTAYVVVVLAAYFSLPPAELTLGNIMASALLVLVAVGIVLGGYVWGLRSITRARYPVLRSFSILIVVLGAFIVVFSYVYLSMATRDPESLPGLRTHLDGLYFTVTMLSTVGFGDISPTSQPARAVATAQMVFNLVFLGALLRTAVSAGRMERQRRTQGTSAT
jgi:hypothetical protein